MPYQPTITQHRQAFRRCFDAASLLISYLLYKHHIYPLVSREYGSASAHNTAMKYATALATMLALRQLHEFFLPHEHRRDIRALHFGYVWRRPLLNKAEKQKIDQMMIHLSFEAFRYRNTPRNFAKAMRKAIVRYLAFVEHCERTVFRTDRTKLKDIQKIKSGFAFQLQLIAAYEAAEAGQ